MNRVPFFLLAFLAGFALLVGAAASAAPLSAGESLPLLSTASSAHPGGEGLLMDATGASFQDRTNSFNIEGRVTIDAALATFTPTGRITGRVTSEADGSNLAGIQVMLGGRNGGQSAFSGADGLYDIGGLDTGDYIIFFYDSSLKYLYEFYDNKLNSYSADTISVTNGSTTNVDAALAESGQITGKVTARSDGSHLEGILVHIEEIPNTDESVHTVYTGADGVYRIKGLRTGTYRLGFTDYSNTYADEYYKNVWDRVSATLIPITEGATTTIDARLLTAGSISGHVTDETGQNLEYTNVEAYYWYKESWVTWQSDTETERNGQYELTGLPPGLYRIYFLADQNKWPDQTFAAEYYVNVLDFDSATDVLVRAGKITEGIDAVMGPEPPPAGETIYVSSSSNGSAGGVAFQDEDILVYDTQTGQWSMYLDGSDVGLGNSSAQDIDAFAILEDGSVLLSLVGPASLPGIRSVDDSDIVRFVPASLGDVTAGTFELYFDGSDVGLTTDGEDVDAITVLTGGDLLISTTGRCAVAGLKADDEDLLRFAPSSLGKDTQGGWFLHFDGSDVGLSSSSYEDVWGAWNDVSNGDIYLTTMHTFKVSGAAGDGADILKCTPNSVGNNTSCAFSLYWDGSAHGYTGERMDGFAIGR